MLIWHTITIFCLLPQHELKFSAAFFTIQMHQRRQPLIRKLKWRISVAAPHVGILSVITCLKDPQSHHRLYYYAGSLPSIMSCLTLMVFEISFKMFQRTSPQSFIQAAPTPDSSRLEQWWRHHWHYRQLLQISETMVLLLLRLVQPLKCLILSNWKLPS